MSIHTDIIEIVRSNGGATFGIVCDRMEAMGYGGTKPHAKFMAQVQKWLTELVHEGALTDTGQYVDELGSVRSTYAIPSETEMASDVAELEQPATATPNVANHDAESRAKRKQAKPYTPNRIAGAYSYRGSLVIKLDRKASARSITLSHKDMAMLTSIYGNVE